MRHDGRDETPAFRAWSTAQEQEQGGTVPVQQIVTVATTCSERFRSALTSLLEKATGPAGMPWALVRRAHPMGTCVVHACTSCGGCTGSMGRSH